MNRPVMQKTERYQNKAHTRLAKGMACMFVFPHICFGDVVACRANWQIFGRGAWFKTPDWAWAAGCMTAHRIIDGDVGATMDADTRFHEWLRAYVSTQDFLWTQGKVKVA